MYLFLFSCFSLSSLKAGKNLFLVPNLFISDEQKEGRGPARALQPARLCIVQAISGFMTNCLRLGKIIYYYHLSCVGTDWALPGSSLGTQCCCRWMAAGLCKERAPRCASRKLQPLGHSSRRSWASLHGGFRMADLSLGPGGACPEREPGGGWSAPVELHGLPSRRGDLVSASRWGCQPKGLHVGFKLPHGSQTPWRAQV